MTLAGKITDLKTQKRNKERVNVYLDGRYGFSLAIHLAVPLRRGQELSDQQIAELKEEDEFYKAYERISKFIAHRPRSEAEVRRRMERQEVPPDVAERVIERLSDLDLLDDAEFARLWVENRETFRPRSRRMLRYELRQKGVSERVIDRALEQVDEEAGARRLALKKGQRLSHLDRSDFRRKLLGYLTRRGFSYELAHRAVESAWESLVDGKDGLESEEEGWNTF
jgi:regulatory protein